MEDVTANWKGGRKGGKKRPNKFQISLVGERTRELKLANMIGVSVLKQIPSTEQCYMTRAWVAIHPHIPI